MAQSMAILDRVRQGRPFYDAAAQLRKFLKTRFQFPTHSGIRIKHRKLARAIACGTANVRLENLPAVLAVVALSGILSTTHTVQPALNMPPFLARASQAWVAAHTASLAPNPKSIVNRPWYYSSTESQINFKLSDSWAIALSQSW